MLKSVLFNVAEVGINIYIQNLIMYIKILLSFEYNFKIKYFELIVINNRDFIFKLIIEC